MRTRYFNAESLFCGSPHYAALSAAHRYGALARYVPPGRLHVYTYAGSGWAVDTYEHGVLVENRERKLPPGTELREVLSSGQLVCRGLGDDRLVVFEADGSPLAEVPTEVGGRRVVVGRESAGGTICLALDEQVFLRDGTTGEWRSLTVPGCKELSSVSVTPRGTVLACDAEAHLVSELALDGRRIWSYGTSGIPDSLPGSLAYPTGAHVLDATLVAIVDSMNHRLLLVRRPGGEIEAELSNRQCGVGFANTLFDPAGCLFAAGSCVVFDRGNRRYLCLELPSLRVRWTAACATPVTRERYLSFPRAVRRRSARSLLIADTGNHRIVERTAGGSSRVVLERCDGGEPPRLHWPRSLDLLGGRVLVADSLSSRVLVLDDDFQLLASLEGWWRGGERGRLDDVHHLQFTGPETFLAVDSAADTVLHLRLDGELLWSSRGEPAGRPAVELRDPHMAELGPGGETLVADTGNDRVLVLDRQGRRSWECGAIFDGEQWRKLRAPRMARFYGDHILLNDSRMPGLFLVDRDRAVVEVGLTRDETVNAALSKSRSIEVGAGGAVLVSDVNNGDVHRLTPEGAG